MESKKTNNIGLIIALVCSVVLSFVLGGYLIYDKLNNQSNENIIEDNKNAESDATNKEENKEQTNGNDRYPTNVKTFLLDTDVGNVYLLKNGDVYFAPSSNLKEQYGVEIKEDAFFGKELDIDLEEINDLLGPAGGTFKGYKLDLNNITSAYSLYSGNGAYRRILLFIDNEGNLSELTFLGGGRIVYETNIEGYTNIVSALQGKGFSAAGIYLVDDIGNRYLYTPIADKK